jgi:hypothetical protein
LLRSSFAPSRPHIARSPCSARSGPEPRALAACRLPLVDFTAQSRFGGRDSALARKKAPGSGLPVPFWGPALPGSAGGFFFSKCFVRRGAAAGSPSSELSGSSTAPHRPPGPPPLTERPPTPPDREPQTGTTRNQHSAGYRSPICLNKRRNTNLARETRTLCPVGQPALNPWV